MASVCGLLFRNTIASRRSSLAEIYTIAGGERLDIPELMPEKLLRKLVSNYEKESCNRLMKQFLEARKMMHRITKSGVGKRKGLW